LRSTKIIEVPPASPGLSRERIVDAALELIDRDGLEAFSVRGLAQHLSVYPTALYWHVPNRNALLGDVVSSVLSGITPPDEPEWTDWLRKLMRSYRAAVRKHPNVAPLIGAQLVSNSSIDFVMIEQILTVLERAGFGGELLRHAYNAVITAMASFVTHEFAARPAEKHDDWMVDLQKTIRGFDRTRYPTLARHMDRLENRSFIVRWQNGGDVPLDDSFDIFVEIFIKGLEALLRTHG